MKFIIALVISFTVASSYAASGDCAKETSERISEKCRLELAQAMRKDKDSRAVRRALERSYPLTKCQMQTPAQQKIAFVKDEATGSRFEISSFVGCYQKDDVDGYTVTGEYFIEGGNYRFRGISLSSAE